MPLTAAVESLGSLLASATTQADLASVRTSATALADAATRADGALTVLAIPDDQPQLRSLLADVVATAKAYADQVEGAASE